MLTDFERQCAGTVVMVRPALFAANTQTLSSNAFQAPDSSSSTTVHALAATEFDAAAGALRAADINVLVLDDTISPHTPDSVFPNNWFSTDPDGRLYLYPMEAVNRRWERRPLALRKLLQQAGFRVNNVCDLSDLERAGHYLEGTGAMVLDRVNKIAFAARSSRAQRNGLERFAKLSGYRMVDFTATDRDAKAIYHSNVMLSIGDRFALVCGASIVDTAERRRVFDALRSGGRSLIDISFAELYGFAGNVLQLRSRRGRSVIALSDQAQRSLSPSNRVDLERHGTLVSTPLDHIEKHAGGSFRCMLAEIFLPAGEHA